MARRISQTQLRSQLRQVQQRQRQAIAKHNAAVRKYNTDIKRAVDDYNRGVRVHNARVRANRQRLQHEIRRLRAASSTTARYVDHRRSVVSLHQSFQRIESAAEAGTWTGGHDLFDLTEGEAANSVAVLNALLTEPDQTAIQGEGRLQTTSLGAELAVISSDLQARWQGALYALSPRNPDAARHFCTSAREILTAILESAAPDTVVLEAKPTAERMDDGRVTRRARVRHCLERTGTYDSDLAAFIESDVENVMSLFREFNDGTHGGAGRFDLPQLLAIKRRVEDAIRFLFRILR